MSSGKRPDHETAYRPDYGGRLAEAMDLAGYKGRDARSRLSANLKDVMRVEISVQAIGQVLTTPGRAFSAEVSARVARLLKVDHYWLATGDGEPRTAGFSEQAKAFAARYDKLTPGERAKFSAALILASDGASDAEVEEAMPITRTKPAQSAKAQEKETALPPKKREKAKH